MGMGMQGLMGMPKRQSSIPPTPGMQGQGPVPMPQTAPPPMLGGMMNPMGKPKELTILDLLKMGGNM